MEVSSLDFYRELNLDDYFRITLTDEQDIPDAAGRLRSIYPNLMRLDYDNLRTQGSSPELKPDETGGQPPLQLFAALYERQNHAPLSPTQEDYLKRLIEQLWEEEV